MGRIFVELDPDGYKYAEEPGFYWYIDGPGLLERFKPDPKKPPIADHNFYVPPGSEWLMPRPRQFSPRWYADSRLIEHVIDRSRWTFASGVQSGEWEFTVKPGEAGYPDNLWITLTIPASVTSLDATDYGALGTAAGVTLPSGMATVAFADTTPVTNITFNLDNDLSPQFQYLALPEPDDPLVFGWGQYAAILTYDTVTLLRSPNNDKLEWELLDRFSFKRNEAAEKGYTGLLQMSQVSGIVRGFTCLTVGYQDLWFLLTEGEGRGTRISEEAVSAFFSAGAWWIGAAPKQRVSFQAQVVGYEDADTTFSVNFPNQVTFFDLGSEYKPTQDPELWAAVLIHAVPGFPEGEITQPTPAEFVYDSVSTGEVLTITLLDAADSGSAYWDSDGTRHRGGFQITITPGSVAASTLGQYVTPQLRLIELKFPVKLVDRVNAPLVLDDSQFHAARVSASLREPDGKRLQVDLMDDGLAVLSAGGYDLRDNYPIHITEDTDGDDIPDTVRAAGWVVEPELELVKDKATPFNLHRLTARGILSRADTEWMYLPQLVDPRSATSGRMEHTYAVAECLRQKGIDVDDPDSYEAETDPFAGSVVAQLPGQWGLQPGAIGKRVDSPYAPDWDQTALEYCAFLGEEFRGWVLYEDLSGVVRYHTHLILELQLGVAYWSSATIYRSKAAAVAAGLAGQYGLAQSPVRSQVRPLGNVVRVTGKDPNDPLAPQLLDRAPETVTDIEDENFLGEWRPVALVNRLNVDRRVMGQIARVKLLTAKRRAHLWQIPVPLPPWRIVTGPVDVGRVVTLDGRGPHLVTHVEWEVVKSDAFTDLDYHLTTLTCEKLPAGVTAGSGEGRYPGVGVVE